jgi:hypothetical protein
MHKTALQMLEVDQDHPAMAGGRQTVSLETSQATAADFLQGSWPFYSNSWH